MTAILSRLEGRFPQGNTLLLDSFLFSYNFVGGDGA